MKKTRLKEFQIRDSIERALREDVPVEDLSTNAIYREKRKATVSLIAKEDGIICGMDVFELTFKILDDDISLERFYDDGDSVKKGEVIGKLKADVRTILTGERVALNYLQRMSGIATNTAKYVKALGDDKIKIMDTRKTTPNMRIFEKYAVKVGGGENHRFNLSDGIMLKDNHIGAAGSVTSAIQMAKEYYPFIKKIEIEVENLNQLKEALTEGVDIIMLDNMDIQTTEQAIKLIDKRAIIECSGNISLDNIGRYRGMDIDFISSGALTYEGGVLDISMKNLRYEDE
ncbi:MAG: carboxylating nicotinate-nucleotide diphosphorylase [Finegoldia sp.]|nr:carboxylating nicotinate-nucleotide diphosphorylase [Finegoldia sp.]